MHKYNVASQSPNVPAEIDFGLENCPKSIQHNAQKGHSALFKTDIFCHFTSKTFEPPTPPLSFYASSMVQIEN